MKFNNTALNEYKKAANDHVKIRREAEMEDEKFNLFYEFVNGELKVRDRRSRLRARAVTYEKEEETCETIVVNDN